MAVVDYNADANVEAGKLANPAKIFGSKVFVAVATVEVAAGDDDGSVYRLFNDVPANMIPTKIEINNDAITGGTDYDLGLYKTNDGAVVDKDVFMDGTSMASARTEGSPVSGLTAVDVANLQKKLYEHAGASLSTRESAYDIALTANTVGTAAGTITVRATFVQG